MHLFLALETIFLQFFASNIPLLPPEDCLSANSGKLAGNRVNTRHISTPCGLSCFCTIFGPEDHACGTVSVVLICFATKLDACCHVEMFGVLLLLLKIVVLVTPYLPPTVSYKNGGAAEPMD